MRPSHVLRWLGVSCCVSVGLAGPGDRHIVSRQDSTRVSALPTLGQSFTASSSVLDIKTVISSALPSTVTSARLSSSDVPASITSATSNSTQLASTASDFATASMVPASGTVSNSTTTDVEAGSPTLLPLQPRITPALAIAGVVLIVTGVLYALVGVKNKWVQVFLSAAYLSSLSVLVLIIYVINPPTSNAVQGAYFVGVFMTGIIFGAGALVFKDITEGLGCLLGGFSLSMWFLTLKEGGLVSSTGGKAIVIAVFCVLSWSLSFSHHTRAYGLIGSTSFSGATALVLGVDCFSKAGLKEFWVYVWALNTNLFPLNTSTFPITRGIRVETIIIVLGCVIGVISQIRLWRVVKDKQRAKQAAVAEDVRRKDAVEEALGRHLERQNDRDRSEWEKRYGDRLQAKRNTVLWSDAQPEKPLSNTSTTEVDSSDNSGSIDSLELQHMPAAPKLYPRNKRQSNMSVQAIPEEEEDETPTTRRSGVRDSVSSRLQSHDFKSALDSSKELKNSSSKDSLTSEKPPSLRPATSKPSAQNTQSRLHLEPEDYRDKKRRSIPSLNELKRRSIQSLKSRTSGKHGDRSPTSPDFSTSQEALVTPPIENPHSRASSVAATLDLENENLELPEIDGMTLQRDTRPPQIVISSVGHLQLSDRFGIGPEPLSPSALSDDADPEALVRLPEPRAHATSDFDDVFSGGAAPTGNIGMVSRHEELTQGALDQIPSQLSNVVLSYRTNEWAKHITTADMPEAEETTVVTDEEAPAHLVDPATVRPTEPMPMKKPPELPSPTTTVAPSPLGLTINPDLQPIAEAPPTSTAPVYDVVTTSEPPPVLSLPEAAPVVVLEEFTTGTREGSSRLSSLSSNLQFSTDAASHVHRSKNVPRLSNATPRQDTMPGTIDENQVTNFVARPLIARVGSQTSIPTQRYMSPTGSTPNLLLRADSNSSHAPHSQHPGAVAQSSPLYSMALEQNYSTPNLTPNPSYSPYASQLALRSEVRLHNPAQSHQPVSRAASYNSEAARRENMLADWRNSMQRSQSYQMMPAASIDRGHAQFRMEREAAKLRTEQERYQREMQQAQFDQSMRTQGMIDAHKEVLRRMQSQANQKLNK